MRVKLIRIFFEEDTSGILWGMIGLGVALFGLLIAATLNHTVGYWIGLTGVGGVFVGFIVHHINNGGPFIK